MIFKYRSEENNELKKDINDISDVLNKTMEKLRARIFTLAESSLPEGQANSFKKAVKDYTSEAWNILTAECLKLKSKEKKDEDTK